MLPSYLVSTSKPPLDNVNDRNTINLLRKHGGKTGKELKADGK
jgi:hypothetical protein